MRAQLPPSMYRDVRMPWTQERKKGHAADGLRKYFRLRCDVECSLVVRVGITDKESHCVFGRGEGGIGERLDGDGFARLNAAA